MLALFVFELRIVLFQKLRIAQIGLEGEVENIAKERNRAKDRTS